MKIRAFTAALTAAIAVALAGCGSDPAPASDDHVHIDPLDPTHMEADQLASLAMQVILSWKPVTDASPTDALHRAKRWLGGELLHDAELTTTAPSGVRPDHRWQAWRTSGDAVTATCQPVDEPAVIDGQRTKIIDLTCRQTVLHRSGDMTPLAPETWRATLTRISDGWRLSSYQFVK